MSKIIEFYQCIPLLKAKVNFTTVLRPFVWDYPGAPVPKETITLSHILIIVQPLSGSSIYCDP